MQLTATVNNFVVGLERFATHAVLPDVRTLIKIVRVTLGNQFDECRDARFMVFTRGANELIVADAEALPCVLKPLRDFIGKRLR